MLSEVSAEAHIPAFSRLEVDARRTQLLEVATERFGQRSYDRVSVEEIADAAGVSRGLLYHYFPGKRSMYIAVIRAGIDRLIEATTPPEGLSPREQLRYSLDAYISHALYQEHPYQMALRASSTSDRELHALVDSARTALVERVLASLDPSDRTAAVELSLHGWVGYVESICQRWLAHRDVPRETLVELMASPLRPILTDARRLD
jgi:AcrR family transcriptional regulator